MDFAFKKPNMDLFVLLFDTKDTTKLREYLIEHSMYSVYTNLVQKGLFKNNKEDFTWIVTEKENKLKSLLEEKNKEEKKKKILLFNL